MNTSAHMTRTAPAAMLRVLLGVAAPLANDGPEFRGEGRVGVWTETGILEAFPEAGLDVRWRTPIHHGFSGPSVSDGRIFITDFERARGLGKSLVMRMNLNQQSSGEPWNWHRNLI